MMVSAFWATADGMSQIENMVLVGPPCQPPRPTEKGGGRGRGLPRGKIDGPTAKELTEGAHQQRAERDCVAGALSVTGSWARGRRRRMGDLLPSTKVERPTVATMVDM